MLSDYVRLSLNNLKRRGLRSWLTTLGIVIGIAAVVGLISLAGGLENAITSQIQQLGADSITVQARGAGFGPPGAGSATSITQDDMNAIERVQGIEETLGRLITPTSIQYQGTSSQVIIASIPEETAKRNLAITYSNYDIEDGRMLRSNDRYNVVVGNNFKDSPVLGEEVRVGDTVVIEEQEFDIVGIFERTGSFQTDSSFVINDDIAREIFDRDEEFDVIQVQVSNIEEIDIVADDIRKELRSQRDVEEGREDFEVSTSQDTLETVNNVLGVVTAVIVGIAGISLLVGGIGIMNSMYTSVLERTRDIGIMKSVGAKNSDVFKIFLIESGFLGIGGGIIGIIIGGGMAYTVELIGRYALGIDLIQASFTIPLILGTLLFSFILGCLAGSLPAIQAARLNPVEALRK